MSRLHLFHPQMLLLLAIAATVGIAADALAQSTTRVQPGSTTRSGSTTKSTASAVALEGYCPVCVVEMKKWIRGNPSFQASYDGKTYYFPGEDQKRMFTSAPDKYVPALGGDCVVCMADMGARSAGSIRHSALSQNRLYLFPSDEMKMKFASNPRRYIKADVALGGNCTVCRVEMNKDVPGSPDVYLRHGGIKYQFASDDQRTMFMANPTKYAIKPGMPAAGSTTR